MTSADWALWVTAAGTWAIGVGGFGAFMYARKTFEAQREQLELARRDSLRMRTPTLRGELGLRQPGGATFVLKIGLISPEPVASVQMTIVNLDDCPVGFTTGQEGVETWPEPESLPPGWRHDTTRHVARRDELLVPGAHTLWVMAYRKAEFERGECSGELSLRAEGTFMSREAWSAQVAVTVTDGARQRLSAASG